MLQSALLGSRVDVQSPLVQELRALTGLQSQKMQGGQVAQAGDAGPPRSMGVDKAILGNKDEQHQSIGKQPPEQASVLSDWPIELTGYQGGGQDEVEIMGGWELGSMESVGEVAAGRGRSSSLSGGQTQTQTQTLGDDVLIGIEAWELPPLPPPPCFD